MKNLNNKGGNSGNNNFKWGPTRSSWVKDRLNLRPSKDQCALKIARMVPQMAQINPGWPLPKPFNQKGPGINSLGKEILKEIICKPNLGYQVPAQEGKNNWRRAKKKGK